MPLSHFISRLENRGELIRIAARVSACCEMAEIVDRVHKSASSNKALLFENCSSKFPVVMNMYGTEKRMATALGANSVEEIRQRIEFFLQNLMVERRTLWDKLKLLPMLTAARKWLPKRVAIPRSRISMPVDLNLLPITTSWAEDGGKFITLPMVHTTDLLSGSRNVGMYRMQILSPTTTAMHWHIHKTGARHFRQYKDAGRRMPVAVALGGDPCYAFCAAAPLPDGVDEYLLAGFLRNKPVELMPCISQPIYVPADSDFVIEGYIAPQESLVVEGPFGDHTGFYSLLDYYPQFHVTAITRCQNAIYPATLVGVPPQEDYQFSLAIEKIFLPIMKTAILPEITDIHMPAAGVAHNLAIVSIKKEYAGQVQKTANALWGAGQMMFNKILIITKNSETVEKCRKDGIFSGLSLKNFSPARDIYYGYGAMDALEHASTETACGSKICIDLTNDEPCKNNTTEIAFIHSGEKIPQAKIVAIFDNEVEVDDHEMCLWLMGANIDPMRDCVLRDGKLIVDATAKPHLTKRAYPNVVCSSLKTIEKVDAMWASLCIGEFVESPSRRILPLMHGTSAERFS